MGLINLKRTKMENNNYLQEEKYLRAQKKVHKMQGFYIHLAVYIVINLFLAISSGIHAGMEGFLSALLTTGLFWGIGVFFHWYSVFGINFFLGKDWEEKKIKELMDKE
ncbi:MAG: 2TM domain-containing protein [Flavobacteriaceae bacterium]|nr:2TM domain-containing protein [Flavobacteriaceae bacterium]